MMMVAKLLNFITENGGLPVVSRPSGVDSSSQHEPADIAMFLQDQLDTEN
jgi:hypothetical protein